LSSVYDSRKYNNLNINKWYETRSSHRHCATPAHHIFIGVWTLLFGAAIHVEKFTIRKFLGVLASLTGIILISRVDLSGTTDENRGSFPHKTTGEIAVGDAMAAFSAILYGVYTIVMKKQVGSESKVNMQLFFGLVGLFNTFLLWPGFIILHFTGLERFSLPESNIIWAIILVRPSPVSPHAPPSRDSILTNPKLTPPLYLYR
jgi:hypothetical protein